MFLTRTGLFFRILISPNRIKSNKNDRSIFENNKDSNEKFFKLHKYHKKHSQFIVMSQILFR